MISQVLLYYLQKGSQKRSRDNCALTSWDLLSHRSEVKMTEEYFRNNNKLVLYYTGLNTWELLYALFLYVKPHLMTRSAACLHQCDILHLNISLQILAFISMSTVPLCLAKYSSCFVCTVYQTEATYNDMAGQRYTQKTMPMTFCKHLPAVTLQLLIVLRFFLTATQTCLSPYIIIHHTNTTIQ